MLLSQPTTIQVPGLAPRVMSAACTAATLAAAASTAAAAKMEASSATQFLATMQALATSVATHAPCASPSQVDPLFKGIQASPFHQGTAQVMAVYVQSLLTNAPPLIIQHRRGSSPIVMDRGNMISNICQVADPRHFIKDAPQRELQAKVPHTFETSYSQGERTKANQVQHIPANTMTMPPEAKLLESHHVANMTPLSRRHAMDPMSTDALASHNGSKSVDILSKSGKLRSCNFAIVVIKEWENPTFLHHYAPSVHSNMPNYARLHYKSTHSAPSNVKRRFMPTVQSSITYLYPLAIATANDNHAPRLRNITRNHLPTIFPTSEKLT